MTTRQPYPTDLTDARSWLIEPLVPKPKPVGRPATVERREIVNAILCVVRGGIEWRAMPHAPPCWKTVWHYFRLSRDDGAGERLHEALRDEMPRSVERELSPSAAIIAAPAQTGLSYWNFAHRYCDVRVTAWGTKIVGNLPDGVERLMEDFRGALWSPPREIAPELTPIHTRVVEVPLWGDQPRVYLEMEAQFKALLDEQTGDTLLAPNTMVQGLRLMRLGFNPGLVGGEIGHLAGALLAGGRLLSGRFPGASPREDGAGRGGRTAGDGQGTRDDRPRDA